MVELSTLNIADSSFVNGTNKVPLIELHEGGIALNSFQSQIEIKGTLFKNITFNFANGNGGAVYIKNNLITETRGQILLSNSSFTHC